MQYWRREDGKGGIGMCEHNAYSYLGLISINMLCLNRAIVKHTEIWVHCDLASVICPGINHKNKVVLSREDLYDLKENSKNVPCATAVLFPLQF